MLRKADSRGISNWSEKGNYFYSDPPDWYPVDTSDSIHTGADLAAADAAFLELCQLVARK